MTINNIKQKLGTLGEEIACNYLIKKGYKIIERNFKKSWGELDIIARAPDQTLVFIEVKTLRQNPQQDSQQQLSPEDQLTKLKLSKIQKSAIFYAGYYPKKIIDEKGWRIDLLAIVFKKENYSITHYENIAF